MNSCLSCHTKTIRFFSLGKLPLVNNLLSSKSLRYEKKYDLSLGYCPKCNLVQLTKPIKPEELFNKYVYVSATSSTFINHAKETAKYLARRFCLTNKHLVVELASNDGTQLAAFKELGIKILGVDPAKNIARIANKNGLPTIDKFFSEKFAISLRKKLKNGADLIFGANVLAHVPNINDFLLGVKTLLSTHATAVFESPYIQGIFENKFDTIYHEHVFYYSITALVNVFHRNNLEIYDVDFTPMQGGSFRIYASYPGVFSKTVRLKNILKKEKWLGYKRISTYRAINKNVNTLKRNTMNILSKIKQRGKSIAAYSAPAKGIVLLNYFGITKKYIDFIVDKSPQKQGFYVPGIHMPILSQKKIFENKPDYVIILCWNIAEEVIKELHVYHKNGGKFIIPIPKCKVL